MEKITYEDIQKANETIKTTDIKGKEYAEVNQRIKAFRMVYPQGSIVTQMVSNDNGICVFKATVGTDDGVILGTGTAYEKEDSSFINKTSYIENCETSAVGRALGMAGFGIDVSVASAEEVQNAINNQKVTQEEADKYTLTFGKYKGKTLKEIEGIDINSDGLILYINASVKVPENITEWKSLIGSKIINLHNTMDSYFVSKSDGTAYLDNIGLSYGTLEENLNLGTSMTLIMKINPNSISAWTEMFSFGIGDSAVSLTYGNSNNLVLFAHDDVINTYITLATNNWYEVATVLYLDKIKYYLNGVLVGTSNLDSNKSTE